MLRSLVGSEMCIRDSLPRWTCGRISCAPVPLRLQPGPQVYGTESFYGTRTTRYTPKGFVVSLRVVDKQAAPRFINPLGKGLSMMQLGGVYDMYKHEGIRGLFRGNSATMLQIVPSCALQVLVFYGLKGALLAQKATTNDPTPVSLSATMVMSAVGGLVSHLFVYPFIVARTRLAVDIPSTRYGDYKYRGVTDVLRKTYNNGGIRTLYRGLPISLLGGVGFISVHCTLLKLLIDLMPSKNDGSGEVEDIYAMTAGIYASRVSQLLTYPMDTLRHRMQVDGGAQRSLSGEFHDLVSKGGYRQLFRGVMMNLYKIGPSVSVTYLTYNSLASSIAWWQNQQSLVLPETGSVDVGGGA
eukprot:TRINITY_DN56275_c0_g1_i1.p1 TRINITY_DN56275_c0_g1~~TRINITY_DN56275_c0_g1_i1.p1  ORF type:complete len:354 (+),score=36.78 TRINITY_DN56275_c0_g1_i1:58-1119(+)